MEPVSKLSTAGPLFGLLRLPRTILFGIGQRNALGSVAAGLGRRALICTDSRFSADPAFAHLLRSLEQAGVEALVYDQVQPDIPRDTVLECCDVAKLLRPDQVIGIGGGSCLDMAKCAALILAHGGRVEDYYGEFKVPGPTLPVIAMPTTAGTGSEVTPVAVLSDPDRVMKIGISSPHLVPHIAICDPELTLTCPPKLTAIAGADAMTHAIEAFTTVRREADAMLAQQHVFVGKSALTDHFALLAIRLLARSLRRAVADGSDTEARADVMMGAMAAGCAFGSAGTAAAHAIQYPIGALTHTAHGMGVATLLPYVMAYNRPACIEDFAEVARAMGIDGAGRSDAMLADLAIDGVAQLFADIGIPADLATLGLPADQQGWAAEQAITVARLIKNNPRSIDLDAMKSLVGAAFAGDRQLLDTHTGA
ncbi:iron-containing alcohol dehydrogenase [Dongia soli]|uniref:Iron-containing alcohol dehydrogenase n=1 Tax=Dongia soli TaxID=600628 RepID=A0ABU5E5A6_9PROT|nr:iron-containing alcohol dehydrogenase [Dongia soli]MDY0881488.1 iron-containing alcohol dehydrogenase [Dongia soli]